MLEPKYYERLGYVAVMRLWSALLQMEFQEKETILTNAVAVQYKF